MANCSNCGNEIIAGAAFCGSCGMAQENKPSNCPKCGKKIEENEKFCSGCRTPITKTTNKKIKNQTPLKSTAKKEKSTHKYNAPLSVAKPKKNTLLGCLKKTVIAILAVLVVGFVIIWILPDDNKDDANKTENNNKLYEKVIGSWSVVDVATGKIDNSGAGWNFVEDGTCYQDGEKNKNISDRRKWRINEYDKLEIDFVEQTISYKISFEGDKMFFERYKPYYYYIRK